MVLHVPPQVWRPLDLKRLRRVTTVWFYSSLAALGPFTAPALIGQMNIWPLNLSPRWQYMMTKELHVWRRQNGSKDLVTQWRRRIVLRFVIWISQSMGQEAESLTVSFTLTFSRRKQCRRNHLIIHLFSLRGSTLGEIRRGVQSFSIHPLSQWKCCFLQMTE